jgi:hypothetical protein
MEGGVSQEQKVRRNSRLVGVNCVLEDYHISRRYFSNLMLRSVRPSSRRDSRVQAPVLLTKDAIVGLGTFRLPTPKRNRRGTVSVVLYFQGRGGETKRRKQHITVVASSSLVERVSNLYRPCCNDGHRLIKVGND